MNSIKLCLSGEVLISRSLWRTVLWDIILGWYFFLSTFWTCHPAFLWLIRFLPCKVFVAQLCVTPCDLTDCRLVGSSCPWNSLGKNTGVGCHFLFQGIFPTQGSNPGLLHWRQIFFTVWATREALLLCKPLIILWAFSFMWWVAFLLL